MVARAMAVGLELGFAMATPLVIFLLLGLWLDKKFDTMPLFVVVCLLAGLIAVFVEVKQLILPFLEKRSKNK
jgi:F0F1-type ATP synthase assembly protein I